ncbi:Acetyltransferase (GNAT) family protein [Desulfonispora thiosulfatigenes DSM 11270]|uniref:Acetyltransferase (GNAT) family protein n=1 Tax=Desulfonispora thiosulfatigenes DSM 11270 TaxID=656914 RepID=A0A1W1UIC8_DESTI|nr:hypothetical protein [Desulfonispora thiosulfatigenes]SMB80856.1 Acetyltransferase (GNAT) family protein [Desulfonispora thiosulfatigenes DSM 11270]
MKNIENIFKIDLLNESNLQEVMFLQNEIINSLNNPDIYAFTSEGEFLEILTGQGIMVGTFFEGNLCGYFATMVPGDKEDNLGLDLNLDKKELKKVIHYEVAAVHPDFRGNNLQKQMANKLQEIVMERDQWHYTMATVSPFNYPSLNVFLTGLNMVAKKISKKYGNKLRYILYQDLQNPLSLKKEETIIVLNTDYEKQKELFNSGYCAYNIKKVGNFNKVYFAKEVGL